MGSYSGIATGAGIVLVLFILLVIILLASWNTGCPTAICRCCCILPAAY
ncbi:hypothetical protein VQL36_16245 [Chengkuizengella sp. SCS-71B]